MPGEAVARLSTPTRLVVAALLCFAPLRLVWSSSFTPGVTLFGDCGYSDGPYCVGDTTLPGSSSTTLVAQTPAAALLLAAAIAFACCAATRRTARSLTVARGACVATALALALAARQGEATMIACLAGALGLVVPLVVSPDLRLAARMRDALR